MVAALAWFTACSDQQPTIPGINAAAGGSSGDPTVTSANPNNAPQDTTLDVHVFGTNFDRGSKAQWARSGVPSPKVVTNSTRFVSSAELLANITIAVDAETGLYDIIVTTSTGKKGIGTEMFTVRTKGAAPAGPALGTFNDSLHYKVRSDGRDPDLNGIFDYRDQVACVVCAIASTGFYQVRTIAASILGCVAQKRGEWRFFRIEGSGVDLDQDGTVELIEEAPGRFITSNLYAPGSTVTSTPVSIGVLHVNADGTTTIEAEWLINYLNEAPITVVDPVRQVRQIRLLGDSAKADVCRRDPRTGKPTNCVKLGVLLPFRLTAAPLAN